MTLRRAAVGLLPPLLFGVLFVALWQLFVRVEDIRTFVLPAPSDIWTAFGDQHARIVTAAGHSGLNALVGLLGGVIAGVLLAALASRLPILGGAITPIVAGLAAMPIVALAPLLNNMYSPLSTLPRREVVAISAFVPVFFNVLRGLSQLSPVHRELMQSYASTQTDVLRVIRIPNALPHFFTGLRIASSLAVIAAVVSEYFGGLQNGLGSRITSSVGASNYPAAWASVLGAVALGLIFYVGALLLERVVLGSQAAPAT
ncbi:MAG: NitT/TauT family transport system permease protein [Pseudonocardiales bacterium]|jgi:NitT/TauT family transport system permease protein|nr:NitT/TauT family transport system permease protein [Pseudonocardiales bacterium]MDT4920626.1 NitT/TauT family transport system permease protein [Pseudonocardiales bacterium]